MTLDADNVILGKTHVCADYGNPVLAVIAVADTDDAGIYAILTILVLSYFYGYGQKIPGTATTFLAGSKNSLDVHRLAFKDVGSFTAALYHGYRVEAKLLDIQKLLWIGKPAVKEDILCPVTCRQGSLQEIYHNGSGLLAGHEPTLPGNGTLVYFIAGAKNLSTIVRSQKRIVDGQKCATVRPSQGQQPEAFLAAHGDMVKYPRGKFRALETGALIQGVINDKAVIAVLGGQRANVAVDDTLGKHRGKTKPVGARIHEEAVVGVLGKAFTNFPQLVLHIEAPHAEGIGQRVSEQLLERYPLEFRATALAQKAENPIGGEEIYDRSRNILFIGRFK